jgi:cell division protein FtsW (lipid II flippase)
MESQFFTWDALSALAGASLFTFFIVQHTKMLVDRWIVLPTVIYALFIAYFVLLAAQLATGASGWGWLYVPCLPLSIDF